MVHRFLRFSHYVPPPVLTSGADQGLGNVSYVFSPLCSVPPSPAVPLTPIYSGPSPIYSGQSPMFFPAHSPTHTSGWPPPSPQEPARPPPSPPAINQGVRPAMEPQLQRLLYKRNGGTLKKISPNSYMLYRLEHIKDYKGKRINANVINAQISHAWRALPQETRNAYKHKSTQLQYLLDFYNS
ncbi:hypothetical protein H4R19_005855, partial [Coemansia spiralis]